MFVELFHFRSSLTTSFVLEIFPDESLVPSTNIIDPPLDFSIQPPDIFYASPRQVEDEQVDDELPHLELGSPAPAPLKDPPQDIPPCHSTQVRSIPTLHEPHTYRKASTNPYGKLK